MNAIPSQVSGFLSSVAPFDQLDGEERQQLATQMLLFYLTDENQREFLDSHRGALFLVQSGHHKILSSASYFVSEGDYFGVDEAFSAAPKTIPIQVESSGLLYCLDQGLFRASCERHAAVGDFFQALCQRKVQQHLSEQADSLWLNTPVAQVMSDKNITCAMDISIREAAAMMTHHRVSSIMLLDSEQLVGIVTDRDIRGRAVANGLDFNAPVHEIMTQSPVTLAAGETLFDAFATMAEHNIHHLPIVNEDNGSPSGMLSATDMIRQQRSNLLFLLHELSKAIDVPTLVATAAKIPQYYQQHANRIGDYDIAGKILAQATDLITRRLIQFFQQFHGPAPLDFCWLVYGSQARSDQVLNSDQDNALLLKRTPNENESAYFAAMAEHVCAGLDGCGIKKCSGNIMASNPDLRVALDAAIAQTERWVEAPTKNAIMHFNIFLDVRAIAGEPHLLDVLQNARTPLLQRPMFLAALARYIGSADVPLSIFNRFDTVVYQGRQHCLDIKVKGLAVINELIRLYALAVGIRTPSTLERLKHLANAEVLHKGDLDNLREIWLFLSRLRWRHQLQNNEHDNFVSLDDLSPLEKHQLKDAFLSIKRAQKVAVMRFSGGVAE